MVTLSFFGRNGTRSLSTACCASTSTIHPSHVFHAFPFFPSVLVVHIVNTRIAAVHWCTDKGHDYSNRTPMTSCLFCPRVQVEQHNYCFQVELSLLRVNVVAPYQHQTPGAPNAFVIPPKARKETWLMNIWHGGIALQNYAAETWLKTFIAFLSIPKKRTRG